MPHHPQVTKGACSWCGPPASGTRTPTTFRGPAAIRHPWRGAALAASMPLDPLRVVCVWPAPRSRFVVSGLSRTRATLAGANAPRRPRSCTSRSRCIITCRSALALGRTRTICREPAARPVHAVCQAESSRLILLPLRGKSRAGALLQGLCQPGVAV